MILSLDPSLTHTGWSVFDLNDHIVDCGVIITNKSQKKQTALSDDRANRLKDIAQNLADIIKKHKIKAIVSEMPMGSQNASAAVGIGGVTGIIVMLAVGTNKPLEWITPIMVKKYATNKKNASKEDMMNWCKENYPSGIYPAAKSRFEHIADSVAVYDGLKKHGIIIKTLNQI